MNFINRIAPRNGVAPFVFAFLAGVSPLAVPFTVPTTVHAAQENAPISVRTSLVAPSIALPAGTERVPAQGGALKLFSSLEGDAASFGDGEIGAREILGWDFDKNPQPFAATIKRQFIANLKAGGYVYDEVGPVQTTNPAGPIQRFYIRSPKAGKRVLGFWIHAKTSLILVWAEMTGGPRVLASKAPEELVGRTWRATRISGTTFWAANGAYNGAGTQQAGIIQFLPNGTYKYQVFIQTRSNDWGLQAYTWENGTASFDGNLVVLRPTGGKYKGVDTKLAHNNFERPMTEAEIRNNVRLYRWEMSDDKGKPVLRMGNGKADLSTFHITNE